MWSKGRFYLFIYFFPPLGFVVFVWFSLLILSGFLFWFGWCCSDVVRCSSVLGSVCLFNLSSIFRLFLVASFVREALFQEVARSLG